MSDEEGNYNFEDDNDVFDDEPPSDIEDMADVMDEQQDGVDARFGMVGADGAPAIDILSKGIDMNNLQQHQIQPRQIPKSERMTTPYMTKYERARLLGTRALQISMNAPVLVELNGESDPLEIAGKELREKKLPLMIRRYLPDGSYEDWEACELILPEY